MDKINSELDFVITLINEKKYDQSKDYLLDKYKGEKNHIYFYYLAFSEYEIGNIDVAISHYENSISKKKDFYKSYLNLAILLFKKKKNRGKKNSY